MVAQAALPLAVADALCCVGLGVLLAALYDVARFFLGDAKPVCFVLDCIAALAAAVLLCGFAAGRSYSGVARWYMAAGLVAGLAAYFTTLAPVGRALQKLLKWLLTRPFALLQLLVLWPLCRTLGSQLHRLREKISHKIGNLCKKQQQKRLQKQCEVLYNSN